MQDLERRIEAVERRNQRVEADKAWETSWTRRLSISLLTYGFVVIFLIVIDNDRPWVNALVPVAGFLLSTLALGSVRKFWGKQ
jgi:hypothetical protein